MQPTLEDAIRAIKGEIPAVAPAVAEDAGIISQPTPAVAPTPSPSPGTTTPVRDLVLTSDEIEDLRKALEDLGKQIDEIDAILEQVARQ